MYHSVLSDKYPQEFTSQQITTSSSQQQ